ncbi:hypothetical protein FB107DRAFT_218304 [Schizophyllum commune]
MPLISTTIDALSPFIDYQPQGMWRKGGADGDPYASRYEDKTFMLSIDAPGATATFNFTGTEVHVYGAYRCNSGPYSVTIDGTKSEPTRTNGSAPADVNSQLFQIELFAATDLAPGVHQVVLTNEWSRVPANKSGSAFDVDFVRGLQMFPWLYVVTEGTPLSDHVHIFRGLRRYCDHSERAGRVLLVRA